MKDSKLPVLSELSKSIVIEGIYMHYKGMRYKVVGIARNSETLEELVVYQALYGTHELWVRPVIMFLEYVVINGKRQPRFKLINE